MMDLWVNSKWTQTDRQKLQSHMVLALCPVEIGISIVMVHISKQKLSMGYCQLTKYFYHGMNVCGGVTQSPVRLRKCQFSLICSSCTPKGSELDVYCMILASHWTTLLVNANHLTEVLWGFQKTLNTTHDRGLPLNKSLIISNYS